MEVGRSSTMSLDRPPGDTPTRQRVLLPDATATRLLLIALPLLAILLSLLVWITGLSHSGFWADDFANLTHYDRSLGDLSSDQLNKGKYIINIFWALGTEAFGSGSDVPFLLLTSSVFATGVVMWLRAGVRVRWGRRDAWWIAGVFIATAAWLPLTMWSSNITHTAAFLALGVGYSAHQLSIRARTIRRSLAWSAVGGAAWTLAIVSNLLYVGLLVIAFYCSVYQVLRMRRFEVSAKRLAATVAAWNLVIPMIYFAAIAYPATVASSVYADNGLQFVHANFRYYRAALAPALLLSGLYAAIVVIGVAGGVVAVRRKDWFPLAVLAAAGATALPTFMQGQQRGIYYLSMPLLLTLSGFVAGVNPLLERVKRNRRAVTAVLLVAAATMLVLVFRQGTEVRAYYVQTPAGDALAAFRAQVAALTPEAAVVCATMDLSQADQDLLIAEMSGENGFLVPPISAARAYLVPSGQPCPSQAPTARLTIELNPRGEFFAAS
jgi:hypothetical protein